MFLSSEKLVERLQQRFDSQLKRCSIALDEVTIELEREDLIEIVTALRDETSFAFEEVMDLCGVDYSTYADGAYSGLRYAVVYHLLSVKNNARLRIKVRLDENDPRLPSVVDVWTGANWFEREAFDLFGILFENHPDLRRLLTDYGFIGHPFRKDFPLEGHVEMRYDPERKRVVYEPVTIEPRVNAPRVIRHDDRFEDLTEGGH